MTVSTARSVTVPLPTIKTSLHVATARCHGADRVHDHVGGLLLSGRQPTCRSEATVHDRGHDLTAAVSCCGLASTIGVLIAARAVQGVGAAIVFRGAVDHHDDVRGRLRAQQGARHLGAWRQRAAAGVLFGASS